MAHHRSPNCPQITFEDAIEKARKIYEKEKTHAAARIVVAQDLGYSGINGRSLTLIGTMRQYGILEGSGDALKVTKDAIAYFELDEGEEKSEALRQMVFSPTLFKELHQKFGDELPGDANLRHILVGRGFASSVADEVIRVYKANLELVQGKTDEYNGEILEEKEKPPMNTGTTNTGAQKPNPSAHLYSFALSPESQADLTIKGVITPDGLALLRDQVDLTIRALGGTARPKTDTQIEAAK